MTKNHLKMWREYTFMKYFLTALFLAVALASCTSTVVEQEDHVRVSVTGTLDDGTVFDQSVLEFDVGEGKVFPALEKAVIGMKRGQEKTIVVEAEDAYGEPDIEKIREVDNNIFSSQEQLTEGNAIAIQLEGNLVPAVVKEVKEDTVVLDFNHPLAGKRLQYTIRVQDIS